MRLHVAPPSGWDARRVARSLFWRGWGPTDIAAELKLPRSTVQSWKDRDGWEEAPAIQRAEEGTLERYLVLVAKTRKTGADFKEIDLLARQMERLARVRRYSEPGGHEGDLNPAISERGKKARAAREAKSKKNHFTQAQVDELVDLFEARLYDYQRGWWEARDQRTRMILKSRQIGATWYFAQEALIKAVTTGHNQIFLSASKSQAHIFRAYIVAFANEVGVKLTGEVIHVTSDAAPEGAPPAELHFLGSNYRTAQGYHGDVYLDEFFWTHGFAQLNKVASAMATHKKWRKTYFSTPSSVAHEAHPYWTGARINKGKPKANHITVDVSHKALKDGRHCEDGVWRQIVTVHDAVAGGCDLFDIAELERDYDAGDFANLFGCQFVDDSLSAFRFSELLACTTDSWLRWTWFKPLTARPAGNRAVWAGYDPQESEDGDNAALVIALPPEGPGDKFRLIAKWQLRGDFEEQNAFIKSVFACYHVTYFGFDATGVGAGVFQLVKKWFPTVTRLDYSLEVKARLVMKAQNLFRKGRVEFDTNWTDLIQAFLSIKRALTTSGRSITYKAGRGGAAGHADLAWAAMHIFDNEPLDGEMAPKGRAKIIGEQSHEPV